MGRLSIGETGSFDSASRIKPIRQPNPRSQDVLIHPAHLRLVDRLRSERVALFLALRQRIVGGDEFLLLWELDRRDRWRPRGQVEGLEDPGDRV